MKTTHPTKTAQTKTSSRALLKDIPKEITQHVVSLSFGNNCRDTYPTHRELTVAAVVREMAKPDTTRGKLPIAEYLALDRDNPVEDLIRKSEKDGEYVLPATFCEGGCRRAEDIVSLSGFFGDLDNGTLSRKDIEDKLKGIFFIAYSSYSHCSSFPKWRFFVPYKDPIGRSAHTKIYAHFQALNRPGFPGGRLI